jgi:glycosyltransferase involved in cell wall biosynthesis
MEILLYSSVFWPSLGGVETVTATLAEQIVREGHGCTVVTETPLGAQKELTKKYPIVRRPTWPERWHLVKKCDLVHSNGASVALYPFARMTRTPFIWTHNGYQVSCIDGLGWVDGEEAPINPLASLRYHLTKRGVFFTFKEALKLAFRRCVAHQVDVNIAGSKWVAKRQPLKRQVIAYNPYPTDRFQAAKDYVGEPHYEFIYVGRLVSEKGLLELIEAMHLLTTRSAYQNTRLAIVGLGNLREALVKRVGELNLTKNISFLGPKYGDALIEIIGRAMIGVVPSAYEEPYGGVSLELLAAGKNVIVPNRGGISECIGKAGLTFENGDATDLCRCMVKLLADEPLRKQQRSYAIEQLDAFDEIRLTQVYLNIYHDVIRNA